MKHNNISDRYNDKYVRKLYFCLVEFNERYRADETVMNLWDRFEEIYMIAMKARWVLPVEIHDNVRAFIEMYMQSMIAYRSFRKELEVKEVSSSWVCDICHVTKKTVNELYSSTENEELQYALEEFYFQMNLWWAGSIIDVDFENKYTKKFKKAFVEQHCFDLASFSLSIGKYVKVVEEAYACINEIFQDYLR